MTTELDYLSLYMFYSRLLNNLVRISDIQSGRLASILITRKKTPTFPNTILRIIIIACLLLYFIINDSSWAATPAFQVKTGHPILFVTPEIVTKIDQKTRNLLTFHNYIRAKMEPITDAANISGIRGLMDERTNESKMHPNYFIRDAMNYGVDAYFNNDALSREYAHQYILSILGRPVGYPRRNDSQPRGKLYALGALYDWNYDHLSTSEKQQIREKILDLMDYLDTEYHYYSSPVFTGGHSRLANIVALVALLPIYHDIGLDSSTIQSRYFAYLQTVVNHWRNGYNPVGNWVNKNGGHHMGWAYGTAYSSVEPYLAWEYATNEESWFGEWQENKAFWHLYSLRNDNGWTDRHNGGYDNFPFSGDVWATDYGPSFQGLQLLVSATHYNNGYAKWLYHRLHHHPNYFWDILYNNFPEEEGIPPDDLPLSRHFENSGFVIMRDSWNFEQNTLGVFKSSSFYSINHHHKDQNSFTVYYKGPLAIDSGAYGALGEYGSTHWRNYYTRTVAHNTITVYDPSEVFNYGGRLSNDGGQRFLPASGGTLADIIEGGHNHLDGIQKYEEKGDYVYTMGDASKAYTSSKLSLFQRHMVYLRNHSYNHPAIVIYDKIIATNGSFKKRYLLHSINEPIIDGTLVTITIDDGLDSTNKGYLFQKTLLPLNPEIVKIGGRENDQEFYVRDNGNGNPYNYNDEVDYNNLSDHNARQIREAGQWRVEISPPDAEPEDVFLNVLSITDGQAGETAVQTTSISSTNIDGVIVTDNDNQQSTFILFQKNNTPLSDTLNFASDKHFGHLLCIGLEPNAKYNINTTTTSVFIEKSSTGEQLSSDQGTIYLNTGQSTSPPNGPQNLTITVTH